jgi:lysophospholipid acyltransferase (LPLAT)-like uncharacterized protein
MSDRLVQGLKMVLAPPTWRFLAATVRVNALSPDLQSRPSPVIFACLHRDIIPAILYVRPVQPTLLISKSPDGNILIRTLAKDGFGAVRGSTGRTGGPAFVRLLGALGAGNHLGLAVDGPKGPFGQVREGVIQLSRRSQCPIVPLLVQSRHPHVLGTWDRTLCPWPFSSVTVVPAQPLQVPADLAGPDVDYWRTKLARIFMDEDLTNPSGRPSGDEPKVEGTGHATADTR